MWMFTSEGFWIFLTLGSLWWLFGFVGRHPVATVVLVTGVTLWTYAVIPTFQVPCQQTVVVTNAEFPDAYGGTPTVILTVSTTSDTDVHPRFAVCSFFRAYGVLLEEETVISSDYGDHVDSSSLDGTVGPSERGWLGLGAPRPVISKIVFAAVDPSASTFLYGHVNWCVVGESIQQLERVLAAKIVGGTVRWPQAPVTVPHKALRVPHGQPMAVPPVPAPGPQRAAVLAG